MSVSSPARPRPAANRAVPRPSNPTLSGDAQTATEAALTALTIATAFGFCRVFTGWSWFPTLALGGIASHLVAITCRRHRFSVAVSALLSVVAGAVFVSLAFYRSTSAFGLPTRASWDLASSDLIDSWHRFGSAVTPVGPDTGFVLAALVALWVAAFLADSFAFRAGAAPEAVVPSGLVFIFCSALAADRFRLLSAALWLGAAILFYALHRTLQQDSGSGWLTSHRRGTVTAAARVGAGLGLGAIVIGLALGPVLPGAGAKAIVDTRNPSHSTRQTVSPLVDIQGRIANTSDTELFTVKSNVASYWRLTALDDFDGRLWTSNRTYHDAGGKLGGSLPPEYSTKADQQFSIAGLDSIWLPAAYSPVDVSIGDDVRYDAETESLVTRNGTLPPGSTYSVQSQVPNLTPAELRDDNKVPSATLLQEETALPADFPPSLRQFAQQITGQGATQYDKALLLQNYFRQNFTYDLDVPRGHNLSAIEQFLTIKRGYCEQFAGTFAALARSVGIPTRVAVGFTTGNLGSDGLYHVEGKYAHAWPEVYFTGIGWVPFEPTPTRGAPGEEAYTGVAPQQEGQSPATTVPATTVVPNNGSSSSASSSPIDDIDGNNPVAVPDFATLNGGASHGTPSWLERLGIVAGVLVVLGLLWILVMPMLVRTRWARRRHAAGSPADRVLIAWHETEAALTRSGTPPLPAETPLEYARRASRVAGLDAEVMTSLATQVTVAAYAGTGVDEATVAQAESARSSVVAMLHDRADLRTRLRWRADPRPLLEPLPGDEHRRGHLDLVQS